MEQVLIKEKKYNGQYVAIRELDDATVIAAGENPQNIYDEAVKKGCPEPIIIYVPAKDLVQIYYSS